MSSAEKAEAVKNIIDDAGTSLMFYDKYEAYVAAKKRLYKLKLNTTSDYDSVIIKLCKVLGI